MIESPYTLQIAVDNYKKCLELFPEISSPPKLLFNLESISAYHNLDSLAHFISSPFGQYISGVVIGRSDFSSSLNLASVESDDLTQMVTVIIQKFKSFPNFHITVGGTVTSLSYDNLTLFASLGLSAFETRKCTLDVSNLSSLSNFSDSITESLSFERNWLDLKLARKDFLSRSDLQRITSLNSRL